MAGELILIVEDNEKNRKLVRDMLEFKGTGPPRPTRRRRASAWPRSCRPP